MSGPRHGQKHDVRLGRLLARDGCDAWAKVAYNGRERVWAPAVAEGRLEPGARDPLARACPMAPAPMMPIVMLTLPQCSPWHY